MSDSTVDVLIRGGRVVDGTGNPWRHADVVIAGDRIADVAPPGSVPEEAAGEVVDATGLVVCPGFIDILSHSIVPLMIDSRSLSKVTQGVTTEIMGEGTTPAPAGGAVTDPLPISRLTRNIPEWRERARGWRRFGDWLAAMEEHGTTPNIASFLGGGTLRQLVKGMEMGAATEAELEQMRGIMAEAMEDGAVGVSCALIYPPETYVSTEELIEVARVVAERGGIYITHIRSESRHLLEGIEEAIEIGRRAGLPVEIYHLKASGQIHWPLMAEAIERIQAARGGGLDVTADVYPYTASGTGLTSVLPPWVAAGGSLYDNLGDAAVRARIRDEVLGGGGNWDQTADPRRPESVMPVGLQLPEHRALNGRRLAEIAAERGQDWLDTAMDLLQAERHRIDTIYFTMSEDNLVDEIRQPWVSFGTDAGGMDPEWAAALGPMHPRAYGTYPRILGTYVRERRVLGLEEAIRKMSSAVAARMGWSDRGLLRRGCHADVVAFDPLTIGDRATFEEPHRLSTGVHEVWINGRRVLEGGRHTGATPGRVLRGRG